MIKKAHLRNLALIGALLMLSQCQEEYFAQLDDAGQYLVVDGFITDQAGEHTIYLSQTAQFQSRVAHQPIHGATVWITGTDGSNTPLLEAGGRTYRGQAYVTPPDFAGKIGHSYTLNIEWDGREYQSNPQEILPPIQIDSVYGKITEQLFFYYSQSNNHVYQRRVLGTDTFIQTSREDGEPPKFRFHSIMYLQYFVLVGANIDFCWIRGPVTDYVTNDIAMKPYQPEVSDRIAFLPADPIFMQYLDFPSLLYDRPRVLINKVYTLNDDSYRFHLERNKQLGDEGRFFDPIASQIYGNMRCVSHPEEKAFGLFEASSEFTHTVHVRSHYHYQWVRVENVSHDLEAIPVTGCIRNLKPEHWIEY